MNPCWSPLYPASIAAAKILATPLSLDEFALVHLWNFVTFLGTLVCFDRLLRAAVGLGDAPSGRRNPRPADPR